jgi:hypothetical protein
MRLTQLAITLISFILVLACIGVAALLFFAMLGIYTLVCIFKAKRLPMDTSNRINHIRLWWFVLTRPEMFVDTFPWLKHDEKDNISKLN